MSEGIVYILSNDAMPGLLKIGFTLRSVEERLAELHTTGVPGNFICEIAFTLPRAAKIERYLHRQFRAHHYSKEFFKIELPALVTELRLMVLNGEVTIDQVYVSHPGRLPGFLTKSSGFDLCQSFIA